MPFPRAAGCPSASHARCPDRSGSATSAPPAYRFVDFLVARGRRSGRSTRWAPPAMATRLCRALRLCRQPQPDLAGAAPARGPAGREDLADVPAFPTGHVDFGWVNSPGSGSSWSAPGGATPMVPRRRCTSAWPPSAQAPAVRGWLDDYALYAALKEHHNGTVWNTWGEGAGRRDRPSVALRRLARRAWSAPSGITCSSSYVFREQWSRVKAYANQRGIALIRRHPYLRGLRQRRRLCRTRSCSSWIPTAPRGRWPGCRPTTSAPPDSSGATRSTTGRRWRTGGSTLVDVDRFRATLRLVDAVRLDHFRGFDAYWRVPAGEQDGDQTAPG